MKKLILMSVLLLTVLSTNAQSRRSYNLYESKKGWIISLGGFSLMTAAILEGDKNYTTYVRNTNGQVQKYTKPFMSQTPRNIVFFTGVTLTFTGFITMLVERR